jgi:Transglycosylase SLT domain
MSVKQLIFPGIFLGSLMIILISNMMGNPQVALAQNNTNLVAQTNDNPTAIPVISNPDNATHPLAGNPNEVENITSTINNTSDNLATDLNAGIIPTVEPVFKAVKKTSATQKNKPAPQSSAGSCSLGGGFSENVRQWCDIIDQQAQQYGISPKLIAAVMTQESGGNPMAYSGSGAVGLMQIMARDGIAASFMCGAGPCFANRPSVQQLYDPEVNISYGARMLSGLVSKYGGDVREALRAYGPMNSGYSYADLVLSIYNRN